MESFLKALAVFSSMNSQTSDVKEAEEYLKNLERSKESWPLIIRVLLQDPMVLQESQQQINNQPLQQQGELHQKQDEQGLRVSKDSLFIVAKMLKSKLEYDFGQLNQEESLSLPSSLMQILRLHNTSSKPIQGQLANSFIFLYLHMYTQLPDLIEFLKINFYSDKLMKTFVFLIYEYLPDNVFSQTLVMDDPKRKTMISYFKKNLQQRVLNELDNIAKSEKIEEKDQDILLRIMSNWLDMKSNSEVLERLDKNQIFQLALNSMGNIKLQQASCDVVIAVLRQMKIQEFKLKYSQLLDAIGKKLLGYFNVCEEAYMKEDIEFARMLCRVFVKYGKRTIEQFIQPETLENDSQQFLTNMLTLSSFEHLQQEQELNDFWILLISSILSQPCRNQLILRYTGLINEIIKLTLSKTTFDTELFILQNSKTPSQIEAKSSEFQEKSQQRFYVKELLEVLTKIIGSESIIVLLAKLIQSKNIFTFERQPKQQPISTENAAQLESILYILNQVIFTAQRSQEQKQQSQHEQSNNEKSNIDLNQQQQQIGILSSKSKEFIFEILSVVLPTQYTYVRLNRTLLSIMISSSDFLQQNGIVCELSFDLIIRHLKTNFLSDIAQSAFEVLCKDCPLFVQTHLQTFIEKVQNQMMFNYQIISGISYAVCASDEYIEQYLIKLCIPYANDLINYTMLSEEQQINEQILVALKQPLKALKNIILAVPERPQLGAYPHELLRKIFHEIWPVLKYIMENRFKETGLIENIISVLKQFIIKMDVDFDIFFADFLIQIVQLYSSTAQSGILYILEKCVKIFAQNQNFSAILQNAFEMLVSSSLRLLPNLESFVNNPEMVEDFFGFLTRFLKYFPGIFFSSQHILEILQAVKIGISIQHREAAKSLFCFMEILYKSLNKLLVNDSTQQFYQSVQNLHQVLLDSLSYEFNALLFKELAEVPTREIREYIFDVFLAQISAFRNQAGKFFQPLILSLKDDILTQTEREKLLLLIASSQEGVSQELEKMLVSMLVLLGERFKQSYRRNC